jgi:hypothetical protein
LNPWISRRLIFIALRGQGANIRSGISAEVNKSPTESSASFQMTIQIWCGHAMTLGNTHGAWL